jgi:MFS family permease
MAASVISLEPDPGRTALTYRLEKWRAVSSGILETAGTIFLLLIAVRYFQAGATAKALVASGGSVGLLLTPLVVALVQQLGWPAARAAALLAGGGSVCFLLMAAIPLLPVFVVGSVFSMAGASAAVPLMTQVYQENYPPARRGRFFSRTVMIRIGVAALFSELAGQAFSRHLDQFRLLLLIFAGAFAAASLFLARCPSRPLERAGSLNPVRSLRYVRRDRVFRQTLICWMLMGFANLMMLPMRVEYLANPVYGLALSPGEIAFLIGVVPNSARLLLSPLWGWLFDRMNFFVLRVTLNVGFALGILAFFTSNSVTGLLVGAVIHGIANAGGDVAWGLWVTKFAPPNRVADYMSVHTFFTGVRGVAAPIVAFHLVNRISMGSLGILSGALIVLASLLLLPEIPHGRGRRPAAALTEEVAE